MLRAMVGKRSLEAPAGSPSIPSNDEDLLALHALQTKMLANVTGPIVQSQHNIDDPISAHDSAVRLASNAVSHSPFVGPRDSPASMHLAVRKRSEADTGGASMEQKLGHSMAALPTHAAFSSWSSQHTSLVSAGSQNVPIGTDLS